jgi:hypothetical protein
MILGKSCISSKLLTANLSVITSLFVFNKNVKKTFVYKEPNAIIKQQQYLQKTVKSSCTYLAGSQMKIEKFYEKVYLYNQLLNKVILSGI